MRRAALFLIALTLSGLAAPSARGADPPIVPVDLAGVRQLVAASHGNVVLVNFWATWCVPCMEEFPAFLRLRREWGDKGLTVLLVSIDDQRDTATHMRPFLQRTGVDFPVYIKQKGNDEGFINGIDARWSGALPATFIYDREGRRVQRLIDQQTFEGLLRRLKPMLSKHSQKRP